MSSDIEYLKYLKQVVQEIFVEGYHLRRSFFNSRLLKAKCQIKEMLHIDKRQNEVILDLELVDASPEFASVLGQIFCSIHFKVRSSIQPKLFGLISEPVTTLLVRVITTDNVLYETDLEKEKFQLVLKDYCRKLEEILNVPTELIFEEYILNPT